MISKTNISKSNIKHDLLGVVIKYVVVQFLRKKPVLLPKFPVLLAFIFPDLDWCCWHITNQIFHAFFCLILKLFTLGVNSALGR